MSEGIECFFNTNLSEVGVDEVNQSPEKKINIFEVKEVEAPAQEEYFVVESVLERKEDTSGVYWYLVRWASKEEGRQVWEESWTEEGNLGSGLKEEFEEKQRRMEGAGGGDGSEEVTNNGSGDSGTGERLPKRMKLSRESDDEKAMEVKCTECSKVFKSKRSLKIHLSWKKRSKMTVGVVLVGGSCGGRGVEGGAGDVPDGVQVGPVVEPPLPPTVQIDEEDGGDSVMDAPPPPSSEEEGNGVETPQTIPPPEEEEKKEDLSGSSSSDGHHHHVEDGQKPSTSASSFSTSFHIRRPTIKSVLQAKREVKVERDGEGVEETPKTRRLDRETLGAWLDAEDDKFREQEKQLQIEVQLRKNAQHTLLTRNNCLWDLEREKNSLKSNLKEKEEKLKKSEEERKNLEEKLREEEDKRKKSEMKLEEMEEERRKLEEERRKLEEERKKIEEMLREEEDRRKSAEEDLLASQRLNQTMAEFVEGFVSSQNAQRQMAEAANKILDEVAKKTE